MISTTDQLRSANLRNHCLKKLILSALLIFPVLANAVPAEGTRIMISAPSAYAVQAGKIIAEKGGNLIDVAVAVGLTLAVTNPSNATLGGGGFALINMGQGVDVLDFREIAPAATSPEFYLDLEKGASWTGGAAIGVPGVAAGYWSMHQKYGDLPWSDLFTSALLLAEQGMQVSGTMSRYAETQIDRLNRAGQKHFFRAPGKPYQPGDHFAQPALAKALTVLRDQGPDGFYLGAVAADIAQTVQAEGGVMTLADLENYRVRWLKPLITEYRGHKLYSMPPPSSGGAVIKTAFELFERIDLDQNMPLSVDEIHLMAESLNRAFRGRALLGDPDFHDNPLDRILSTDYFDEMANSIRSDQAIQLKPLQDAQIDDSNETTQFSILDADGNAITLTITLNGSYGSGVVSEKFGIVLNNEMDDFTSRPNQPNTYGLMQGYGNRVQPGKRPLSSMSPTLIEKDGKIIMSVGAAGGPRIISSVIQTIYRVLVTGLDLDRAVQFPRIHHQFLPNKLFMDEYKFSPEVIAELQQRGHVIIEQQPGYLGRIKAVRLNQKGYLEAAYDNRSEGAVGGF